jgi:arylsulfatase A-like enzyme
LAVSSVAVFVFAGAVGWEHTDFLLSGPRWAVHPQRQPVRIAMVSAIGAAGAVGWIWLVLGARMGRRAWLAAWSAVTVVAVALLMLAIVYYRSYDYSMAQLVFPAAVLCGATLYFLVRESPFWPVVFVAAGVCLLYGIRSRVDPALMATGQREVIAHSRAAGLVTLYVLPRFDRDETWSVDGGGCPEARPVLERSAIGIDAEERRNVIIVTVDALRRDVVGMQVAGRAVTPELTRLTQTGVSFASATSPYPATLFAMGSAFTGLSPAELYLSPGLPYTIFTRSRAHVDQQFAVLPDVGWFRLPIVGEFLASGVETTFASSDAAATDAFIARLEAARSDTASVMGWVHYYGPHAPYRPHAEFAFGAGRKNAYLSEVAAFDQQVGRLMQYLNDAGWLEDTLVMFFSDHGEALGERAYFGHHVYLNGWMVDIPLVLWHAQLAPSERRVGVGLADVAPTVLHFLGVPIPSDIAAQSLFTLDPNLENRPAFAEAFPVRGRQLFDSFRLPALDDATIQSRLRSIHRVSKGYEPKGAVTLDRYRLIHHRGANTTLFYDHETDPRERRDQGETNPEARALLQNELERWEREQLRRIQCRLQLTGDLSAPPHPE